MGILDNLAARLGYTKANPQYPQFARSMAEAYKYESGGQSPEAQARLYTQFTWAATAIDAKAKAFAATVEYEVHRRIGEGQEDIDNHPFELVLQNPNPLQSRFELFRDMCSWLSITGESYVWLNRPGENAPPTELWILPSTMVKPVPDGQMYLRGYLLDAGRGQTIALEPWEVMFTKTFNPQNPFRGLSDLASLMTVAQGDIAQQKWNRDIYASEGGRLPGLLAFADPIDDAQWEDIKRTASEESKRNGIMKLRGVGKGGVEWINTASSQKDAQLIDTRAFTKEEVWTKIAPGLLNILDKNVTEANATAGKAVFLDYCLWPIALAFGDRFTKDIMPAYGAEYICAPNDFRETNRLIDLQEQAEFAKYHSINEVRSEYYGEEPVPDGDVPASQWRTTTTATPAPLQNVVTATTTESPEVAAELKAWEAWSLRRIGKSGHEFEPRALPQWRAERIQAALKLANTRGAIKAVFEAETGAPIIADNAHIEELRKSIDAARKALVVETVPNQTEAITAAMTTAIRDAALMIVQSIGALPQPPAPIVVSTPQIVVEPAPVQVIERGPSYAKITRNAKGEITAIQSE